MIVYRVEDKDGFGPFRHEDNTKCLSKIAPWAEFYRLPCPDEDCGLYERGISIRGYYCGFSSLLQFDMWFGTAELKQALHNAGFFLVEYETSEHSVIRGQKQCLFLKNSSTLVSRRELI